jgi:hypothetical protein
MPSRASPTEAPPIPCGRGGSTVAATRCGANAVSNTQVREGSHACRERAEALVRNAVSPHTAATGRGGVEPQAVLHPGAEPARPEGRGPGIGPPGPVSAPETVPKHRRRRARASPKSRERRPRAAGTPKGASSLTGRTASEETTTTRRRARTRIDGGASRGNPAAGSRRRAPRGVPPSEPTGRRIAHPAPRKATGLRRTGLPQGASWSEDPVRALATKPRPKPAFRPGTWFRAAAQPTRRPVSRRSATVFRRFRVPVSMVKQSGIRTI